MDVSKYASLPGIDTQSADVYETSDLPEDDQALHRANTDAAVVQPSIEEINVSFREAQNRFKGKPTDSTDAFNTGFGFFARSEYEILMDADRLSETPVQKYDRLKTEVTDFISSLEKADGASNGIPNSEEMREQAKVLLQQLQNVQLDKVIQCEETILDPENSISKRLTNEITSLTNKSSKSDSEQSGKSDDKVCYELYVPTAVHDKPQRVVELEKRLAKLEQTVGIVGGKSYALIDNSADLVHAVESLEKRVTCLDRSNIDLIEARLTSMLEKLKEVKAKPAPPSEKLAKVEELLEIATKWDAVVDTVPQVVERLTVLESLHQQTLQFSQALNSLDSVQQQISSTSKTTASSVDQLKTTMANNLASVQSSIDSLDARIKKLNGQ